jgi:hypothetical protein
VSENRDESENQSCSSQEKPKYGVRYSGLSNGGGEEIKGEKR